mgnify:CR=1 FL=1
MRLARRHGFLILADECYCEIYNTELAPPGMLEVAGVAAGDCDGDSEGEELPELPPQWLIHEYYEDDVNKLTDVARSERGISTLHEATGGDPTQSPRWHRNIAYGGDQEMRIVRQGRRASPASSRRGSWWSRSVSSTWVRASSW